MTEAGAPLKIMELGRSRRVLVGELDMAGASELEVQLAGCDGDVVLDCSGLTFVDAAGLDALVRTRNACESRGVTFAVVNPSGCLLRLLTITGLDVVFLTGVGGLS